MFSVREKPPLRWTARATAPSGQKFRWAMDETSPENVPTQTTCSDTIPGGFETFETTLLRKAELEYPDIGRLAQIDIEGVGGWKIWQGRVETAPRDTDSLTFKPEASGFQSHLDDFKGAKEIYVDQDLSHWGGPSVQRQINLLTGSIDQEDSSVQTDSTTGSPSLSTSVTPPWGRAHRSEGLYDAQGVPIGSLYYAWKRGSADINTADANWAWSADLWADDIAGSIDTTGSLRAAGPGTGATLTATTTARKFAQVMIAYSAANTGNSGINYTIFWTRLAIYGNHGLTKQGTASATSAQGFLASDVIANAVSRWAPKIQFTTGANGTIQLSSFIIPQLEFRDATSAGEIIKAANRFEIGDWAVWDGPGGLPTFYYNARGARGRAWKARVAPSHLEEAGPSIDRLWNGIFVKYNDVDGTSKIVGPTGTVADATSADLLDTDPLNPANKAGVQRYDLLDMGEVSTPAAAIEVGRRFLIASKALDQSGKATINGYLTDDRGIVHPYHHVRAGDTIAFVDASDPSPRRIVRSEKDFDARNVSLDLDAPPEGLQALLEELGVVLQPLGLGS